MEKINCTLCGTDDTSPYQEEGGYQSVKCNQCGLVYVNPRPTIHEMKELYEGQETQIDLKAHLTQVDKKRSEARRALRYIRKYKPGGKILDIGSAAGYFLLEAKMAGYEVQGLDLTHPFVQFCEEVLGIPAFEGILRDAPFANGSFDVIYHRNVLSHLAYPVDEFAQMHRLLAPGGVLVFETGNVAELPPSPAVFLELPDHLYHFSEGTILKLLDKTGFRHLKTHRCTLFSQLPGIRAIERGLKKKRILHRRGRPVGEDFPKEMPRCNWRKRLAADFAQFMRYDMGEILPSEGRRCTLVVVARK